MNIEDMIYNGASEEEIQEALNAIRAEKARQEAALRAEQLAKKQIEDAKKASAEKEALKAEGRAYLINAILAYSEAFDLVDEAWDEDDVKDLEEVIIKLEEMAPSYIKLMEMQNELQDDLFGGLGDWFK